MEIDDLTVYAKPNNSIILEISTDLIKDVNQYFNKIPNEKIVNSKYYLHFIIRFRQCKPGEILIPNTQ